jgi:hypothetical protein
MAEDPLLQHTVGRLGVELGMARTLLHDVARTDCERAKRGEPLLPPAMAFTANPYGPVGATLLGEPLGPMMM